MPPLPQPPAARTAKIKQHAKILFPLPFMTTISPHVKEVSQHIPRQSISLLYSNPITLSTGRDITIPWA